MWVHYTLTSCIPACLHKRLHNGCGGAGSCSPSARACCHLLCRRNASTLDATGYWIGVWNPTSVNSTTVYLGENQFIDGTILPRYASEDPYAHW
jgi:hypothetical protein